MRDRDAIYQDILRCGRRRSEEACLRSDAALAKTENAHLALIPGLLHCDDERRHHHYLEVDRPRFLRNCRQGTAIEFETLWAELSATLTAHSTPEAIPVARFAGPIVLGYRSRFGTTRKT